MRVTLLSAPVGAVLVAMTLAPAAAADAEHGKTSVPGLCRLP